MMNSHHLFILFTLLYDYTRFKAIKSFLKMEKKTGLPRFELGSPDSESEMLNHYTTDLTLF